MILAPTFADGLAAYYGGRSKIFGVSGKDRSAVSMSGQAGKDFWYSINTGDFVTSTYYYDTHVPIFSWARAYSPKRFIAGFIRWMSH